MTTNEYLHGTEETTRRRELAYGILGEPRAPFFSHQLVVLKVARVWTDHVVAQNLEPVAVAPVDVVLDRDRDLIVRPDVLFIAAERLSIVRGHVWGAPALVAEVLSPGTVLPVLHASALSLFAWSVRPRARVNRSAGDPV